VPACLDARSCSAVDRLGALCGQPQKMKDVLGDESHGGWAGGSKRRSRSRAGAGGGEDFGRGRRGTSVETMATTFRRRADNTMPTRAKGKEKQGLVDPKGWQKAEGIESL